MIRISHRTASWHFHCRISAMLAAKPCTFVLQQYLYCTFPRSGEQFWSIRTHISFLRVPCVPQDHHLGARNLSPHQHRADCGRHHALCPWGAPRCAHQQCLLPLHAAPHRPGLRLLHAHQAFLREYRHGPWQMPLPWILFLLRRHACDTVSVIAGAVVRRGGDAVEQHWYRHVPVCHMSDWGLWRAGHQPAGEPAVCQHHLGGGPRGGAERVWGRVR